MSTPDSSPRSSFPARWGLPALAVLTVLGVITAATLFSGGDKPAAKTPPSEQAQRQADHAPVDVLAGASIPTVPVPAATPAASARPAAPMVVNALPLATAAAVPTGVDAKGSDSLTDPPAIGRPLDPGEPARARVTVGGVRTPLLLPNQVGSFPRVYLPLGAQADVEVQLPEATPGDQVVVAVEDGGTVANGKPVQALTLDENRQVAFQFQTTQSVGIFRVSMRHNAQTKIVTFWAGDRTAAFNY